MYIYIHIYLKCVCICTYMYVCMYIYIYIYICYIYICIYLYIYICIHILSQMRKFMSVCVCVCSHKYIHAYIYFDMYLRVHHIHIRMYYTHMHTYIHTLSNLHEYVCAYLLLTFLSSAWGDASALVANSSRVKFCQIHWHLFAFSDPSIDNVHNRTQRSTLLYT